MFFTTQQGFLIRTARFSHPQQCVPSHRLKSTALCRFKHCMKTTVTPASCTIRTQRRFLCHFQRHLLKASAQEPRHIT